MAFANRWILPVALTLTLLPAAPTFAQRNIKEAKQVAEQYVTQAQLKDYLSFIASDEMEGRDTPSRGLDTVAKFIALNLTRWGFKPAGDDDTFFQKIALRRDQIDPAQTSAEINGQKFTAGDDFLPNTIAATITGPLAYA